MRIEGLNISITKGETASIAFILNDTERKPFVLLTTDAFDELNVLFRVKSNAYATKDETYIMTKELPIIGLKRFYKAEIIDYVTEAALNETLYGDATVTAVAWKHPYELVVVSPGISRLVPDQLFYHSVLKEYRYWVGNLDTGVGEWVEYIPHVTIPFEIADTQDLDYVDYYYDLVLEAKNNYEIEYAKILVQQHKFTVTYRV